MVPKNQLLLGKAEEIDLLQPQVRAMLDNPGFYVGGDSRHPHILVPLFSNSGHVFSMKVDSELPAERFLQTLTLHGPYRAAPPEPPAPKEGAWISANDVNRLVRELDVALNGEAGAAKQAALCDIVAQVRLAMRRRGGPLLANVEQLTTSWKPIETAPMDTAGVVVYARMTCCGGGQGYVRMVAGRQNGRWVYPNEHTFEFKLWMELPPEPDVDQLLAGRKH